jgi:hypothetical protein
MVALGGTAYPQQIREIAGKVLTGDSHVSALESAIAVYDATKEQSASAAAQKESAGIGAVNAEAPDGKKPEEKAMDAAGAKAVAEAKARREAVEKWA